MKPDPTTSMDFGEFDFSGAMKDLTQGLLVKPILHNYLYDARFPAFDLHFPEQEMERRPDNWYHPSTHPMLHARVLYQYLAHPETFPVEKKQYMGTLAVTIGKVAHEFIQMCLTDAGIRPEALQVCEMCPPGYECNEAGVRNTEIGERGHMDGVLDFTGYPNVPEAKINPVLEFKTSHDDFGRLTKVPDMDEAAFKAKWPVYWAQVQRYMHLSKRLYAVVLMMEMIYPFTMREFHIPYDAVWNAQIDTKYRSVRQAVADQRPPFCCGAKGCDVARLCGVIR